MADATPSTTQIQLRLDRLRASDESARAELLNITYERLRRLARKMLRRYPGVHRWEETDDVLQRAAMRLDRALNKVKPATVLSFINLAAVAMRHELIDLARHYYGPQGMGRHHASGSGSGGSGRSPGSLDPGTDTDDPVNLEKWTEFHEKIGALPDEEREVFDLLLYQGLSQAEAAALLGVSERVVKYRWRRARLDLTQMLGGRLPE
jgi:RNA polymerase sigma-70 factor (ECF subfamily)